MAREADGLVALGAETWVRADLIAAVTGRPIHYDQHYALPIYGAREEVRATVLLVGGGLVPAYDDAAAIVRRWRDAVEEG